MLLGSQTTDSVLNRPQSCSVYQTHTAWLLVHLYINALKRIISVWSHPIPGVTPRLKAHKEVFPLHLYNIMHCAAILVISYTSRCTGDPNEEVDSECMSLVHRIFQQ